MKRIITLVRPRDCQGDRGTFGIFINGKVPFAVSLELPWKDNKRNFSCIPPLSYACKLFNSDSRGEAYRIFDVPGRDSVLIHSGNFLSDTKGCVLIGESYEDIFNKLTRRKESGIANSKKGLSELVNLCGKDFVLVVKGVQ